MKQELAEQFKRLAMGRLDAADALAELLTKSDVAAPDDVYAVPLPVVNPDLIAAKPKAKKKTD